MRSALPAKIKLELTLRYLATGDSYKTLQYMYRVGKSSIYEFMPEVFQAVYEALQEYIEVYIRNDNFYCTKYKKQT